MMSFSHALEVAHALYRDRHSPERLPTIALIWWGGVLGGAVFLFLGTALAGGYELNRALNVLSASRQTARVAPPAFDRTGLDTTLAALQARAGLYAQTQASHSMAADPSQ